MKIFIQLFHHLIETADCNKLTNVDLKAISEIKNLFDVNFKIRKFNNIWYYVYMISQNITDNTNQLIIFYENFNKYLSIKNCIH